MSSLVQALHHRTVGSPHAQNELNRVIETKVALNWQHDIFISKILSTPGVTPWDISVHKDYMIIANLNPLTHKIEKVALWSLFSQTMLWTYNIVCSNSKRFEQYYRSSNLGMVLVQSSRFAPSIILLEGRQTGTLPAYSWKSTFLIGTTIFTYREESSTGYFESWDHEGTRLMQHNLSCLASSAFACNECFWVRLSDATLDVIDLVKNSKKTYNLPSVDESTLQNLCIIDHRLIYGTIAKSSGKIHIYDLVAGVPMHEYPIENSIQISKIVANQNYIAWAEKSAAYKNRIKYLNISQQTITTLQPNHFLSNAPSTTLRLVNNLLIILAHDTSLHKYVIDMASATICKNQRYDLPDLSHSFLSEGHIVLAPEGAEHVYIESFKHLELRSSDNASPSYRSYQRI